MDGRVGQGLIVVSNTKVLRLFRVNREELRVLSKQEVGLLVARDLRGGSGGRVLDLDLQRQGLAVLAGGLLHVRLILFLHLLFWQVIARISLVFV